MRRVSLIVLCIFFSSIVYAQDLVFESYNGPLQFERYGAFSQTVVVKNTGIVEVDEPFSSRILLSEDSNPGAGDVSIAYNQSYSIINAGSSVNLQFSGQSLNVSPGMYFMILQLDYGNKVQETDELNNFVLGEVEILPPGIDWEITSLSIDSTNAQYWYDYYPDDLYDPYYNPYFPRDTIFHHSEFLMPVMHIVNNGSTPVNGWLWCSFYLSSDNVLDESDWLIATEPIWLDGQMDITPQFTQPSLWNPWSFMIPFQASPGTYYFIAKVDNSYYGDANGDFIEAAEDNNVTISNSIVIGASKVDLAVGPADATFSNDYLNCNYQLKNLGQTGAGGYIVNAYLSLDGQLDEEDYVFENSYQQSSFLARGDWAYGYISASPHYGNEVKPGMYYLIVQASGVQETDYSNNVYVSETANVQVGSGIYTPNLTITDGTIPGSLNDLQSNFPLAISFRNNESDSFGKWVDFDIVIKNAGGGVIKSLTLSEYISVQANSTRSYTWSLEAGPLALGTYTVEVTPKTSSILPAVTMNLVVDIPSYTIAGTIAGENGGGAINKGKLFLYHKPTSGKVRFINRIDLIDANNFSFEVASYPHTLFYIPDPIAYPDYVPTILGKTVTLQASNFFTLTHDVDTVFEILHTQPLSTGGRAVTGNVHTTSASGRIAELNDESIEGFPVILLSSDGTPVRVTVTDAEGNYSFMGLPEGIYQVVVAFELDQTTMEAPVQANVTEHDIVLNLQIGDTEVIPEVKFGQQITFNEVSAKVFGDDAFDIAAQSSSGLPVSIASSNTDVAIIVDSKIEIVGAGSTTITLIQEGNEEYVAAEGKSYELVVAKADPVISFAALTDKDLSEGSFELSASSNSPSPVIFTSDDEAIAKVEGTTVTMLSAGVVNIMASQDGNSNYNASSSTQELRINVVTNVAEPAGKLRFAPNPVSDFLKIDTPSGDITFQLVDAMGKPVAVPFKGNIADLRGVASGIYLVKVIIAGRQSVERIVKY